MEKTPVVNTLSSARVDTIHSNNKLVLTSLDNGYLSVKVLIGAITTEEVLLDPSSCARLGSMLLDYSIKSLTMEGIVGTA